MKHLALMFFTLVSFAYLSTAFPQQGRPQPPPGSIPGHDQIPPHPPGGWPDDNWGRPHEGGNGGGGTSCAPEVVQGNVAATSRVLSTLAASPDFASAQQFKSIMNEIAATRGDDVRVARYFALIGIDSRDSKAVADFAGAREVRSSWISALERNTGLNDAQADIVASKLQTTLRGDLQ